MSFLDRKMKQAEDQAEKLISDYGQMLRSSPEAASIRQMVATGAPATSVAGRAAGAHQALFKALIANSDARSLLRSKTRTQILEQFCIALWRKLMGDAAYRAMTQQLGLRQGP